MDHLFVNGNKAYDMGFTSSVGHHHKKHYGHSVDDKERERRMHLLGALTRTGWVDFPISSINGKPVGFASEVDDSNQDAGKKQR